MNKTLFYFTSLLLLIFPLGQLIRINVFSPEIIIYPQDLLVFIIFLFWLRQLRFGHPVFKPTVAFFITGLLSLLLNSVKLETRQLFIASLYLWRWLVYAGFLFVVTDFSRQEKNDLRKLFLFVSLIAAVFGLVQYFFWPDFRVMQDLGWDPHYKRVVGTWFDPGFSAMIYVLGIILALVYIFKTKGMKKIMTFSCFAVNYLALSLTYSRSAYLAYLAAIVFLSWKKRSIKFLSLMLILAFITFLLLPRPTDTEGVKLERQATVWSRIESWKNGLIVANDFPLFGVGFNTFRYAQKNYGFLSEDWQTSHSASGVDSSLLFVFSTTGMIGFIVYVSYLKGMVKSADIAVKTSIISLLVHSFFNNSLFYPWIMLWIALILGLGWKKDKLKESN